MWILEQVPVFLLTIYLARSSAGKESTCNTGEPSLIAWVGKITWRRDRLLTPVFLGFPSDSDGKESTCNAGDLGLIPGWGRSSGEGNGNPLQYSFLENSMDRGAWLATVHGVVKSQTTTTDPSIHPPTPSIYLSVSAIEKCIKETKGN